MPIDLSHADRQALLGMVEDGSCPPREARRARQVLLAAGDASDREIAEQTGSSPSTVALWRRRYEEEGIAGLRDRPRSGRPQLAPKVGVGRSGRNHRGSNLPEYWLQLSRVEEEDESVAHLLAAACRTISKRGFASTRMVDIANEAGVSPATVHYHFKTRQGILLDALLWANARLIDEFRDASADQASPFLRMTQTLEQMIPYPGPREDGYRLEVDLWAQARHYPELQQAYAQFGEFWLREITSLVEEGVRSGSFKISSGAGEIAERLLAFSDGLAAKAVCGEISPDRIRRLLMAFAADQLRVKPGDLERHARSKPS